MRVSAGFPRLYVAASLKRYYGRGSDGDWGSFPRLYVAASLKRVARQVAGYLGRAVFRGFMSRPH